MYLLENNYQKMSPIRTPKILCILQLPPPLHGASLMHSHVVNSEIIRNSFDIDVVNLQFAKSVKELKKFSFLKVCKASFYAFEIVNRVVIQRPDLVYFSLSPKGFAFYRDAFYVFLLKLLKRKIVFHLHGKGIKKESKNNFLRNIYKWVFNNTHVICLSKHLSEDISEVYRSVAFIVPNGIKIEPKFNGIVNKSNRSCPQILFLSNYICNKGILILIEALGILHNQGYLFNARLVGAPADLTIEFLENIITNQNLTEVAKVLGPLYGDNKFLEFQNADLFVFPTYYRNEAFPLVILEAMQFSLPVISTFEGGIPEIVIDKETGFLVETHNAQMLAEKIAILLKDKNKRIEMGKKGYERFINNYTLNHFENKMNKTFRRILDTN